MRPAQVDYSPIVEAVRSQVADGLAILLGIGGFLIAMKLLERRFVSRKRYSRRRRGGWQSRRDNVFRFDPKPAPEVTKMQSAADQLRTVMQADFTSRRLLNKSEARLFRAMDKLVTELAPPGWQVMAQVSLGEILSSKDVAAYGCINSKRVDLLIVDEECGPLHAIEYQGGGHHQGTAAARDAVKKEALRRAGIGYVEVVGGEMSPSELRQVVEKLVQRAVVSRAEPALERRAVDGVLLSKPH